MKINKSDWHYKLAYDNFFSRALEKVDLFFSPKPANNLCQYVRQVLKTPVNVAWITATIGYYIAIIVGLIRFQDIFVLLSVPDTHVSIQMFFVLCMFPALFMLAFTLIVVVGVPLGILSNYYLNVIQKQKNPNSPKKESIFKARYAAFKDKTCPLIEIE